MADTQLSQVTKRDAVIQVLKIVRSDLEACRFPNSWKIYRFFIKSNEPKFGKRYVLKILQPINLQTINFFRNKTIRCRHTSANELSTLGSRFDLCYGPMAVSFKGCLHSGKQ